MGKWYSAKDLAALPGLPGSVRGIQKRAKREHWTARHNTGQGGGLCYHWNSLPEETHDALNCKENKSMPVQLCKEMIVKEEIQTDLSTLKQWQRDIFAARLGLYREFERLEVLHGYTKAVEKLVAYAKTGSLPDSLQRLVPQANARAGKGRALSPSTVKGWRRIVMRNGIAALAPKAARAAAVPAWAACFDKIFGRPQKPSLAEALHELEIALPEGVTVPSYHQVRRYHNSRSRLEREKGRHSASALKRFRGYIQRSTDNLLPLDVVQCDGHSFKAKIRHPVHGRPFKPETCAVIDVKTKMVLGFSTGLAESAHTVADALRHSMTVDESKPWGGVPAILYTDKGAGNMSTMLGDEVTGVLTRAGIKHHTGIPGNAQARGLVERTNRQLWISAARKLDTFVGGGMDELAKRNIYLKMEKEVHKTGTCVISELPSWPQFIEICHQAMCDYNNKPHSGLPKVKDAATQRIRHMSPAEAWFTAIRQDWKPTLLDPGILEDLFRPQVVRTTTRAQVSLYNNVYYDNTLEHYHGEKVIIEYDIHKPLSVRVRDMEGRLICVAQYNRNKKDFFPVAEIEQCRERRARGRLALVDKKRDDILAERDGVVVEVNAVKSCIEADPVRVEKKLLAADYGQGVHVIEHAPVPESSFVDMPGEKKREKVRAKKLVSTDSERFNLLHGDLRDTGRKLTAQECAFLDGYYQSEGGKIYLSMVGDLRGEFGVDSNTEMVVGE